MNEIKLRPICDMLIDQGQYINGDPVGHACYNFATHTDGKYLICDQCLELLQTEPERITIPSFGTAQTWKRTILTFLKQIGIKGF